MIALLVAIGALGGLAVVQALLSFRDRRRFKPSGTIVNGLHVHKLGQGQPAVIFESGIANSSLSWVFVQPQLAEDTTTCSYDRGGLGWSAPSSRQCSLPGITDDLHDLVVQFNVPTPMVFVAHSFGGYVARFYAHRFPAEVAGLVLVDPATPEEWMEPNREQRSRLRRAVFFTRAAGVLAAFGIVRVGLWLLLLRKKETPGPLSRFSQTLQRIRFEVRKIPTAVLPFVRAHWSRPGFYSAMAAQLEALPECARAAWACNVPKHVPVTVISGSHQPPERLAEHAGIATRHIIARQSAHFIYLDEPELVVNAVREVLQQILAASR